MKKNIFWILFIVFFLLTLILLWLMHQQSNRGQYIYVHMSENQVVEAKIERDYIHFPDNPKQEDSYFGGWITDKGIFVLKNSSVPDQLDVYPYFVDSNAKAYHLLYMSSGDVVGDFLLEEDYRFQLPMKPRKNGYYFNGWLNEEGKIILDDLYIDRDRTFEAFWIPEDQDTVTISFEKDEEKYIPDIHIEKGSTILLPVNPVKEGSTFIGWYDYDGNQITEESIASENLDLYAKWADGSLCPKDCELLSDGKSCRKESYEEPFYELRCPDGYTEKDGICLDLNKKYLAEYENDELACKNNDHKYEEVYALSVDIWCAPKTEKENLKTCHEGYEYKNDKCIKEEVLSCE